MCVFSFGVVVVVVFVVVVVAAAVVVVWCAFSSFFLFSPVVLRFHQKQNSLLCSAFFYAECTRSLPYDK